MKKTKRLIATLLIATVAFSMCFFGSVGSFALTTFTEGDFVFEIAGTNICTVYSYLGSETKPVLPEKAGGRFVTGIYDNCFKESEITGIIIPDSYQTIGESAFYGCENLTDVKLPASLTTIGIYAFSNCAALENVEISDCDLITEIPKGAFSECKSLEEIIFPPSVRTIGDHAFDGAGLKDLPLTEEINSLGTYAFRNCKVLENIVLPSNW
jgi:hypothetical protein